MRIHGLMVTYKRPKQASATLEKIATQSRVPDTMTVVDNAPSPEARAAFIAVWRSQLTYLPMPENVGPAGGIAQGMKSILEYADEDDWILSIDDDDPPPAPDTIKRLGILASSLMDAGHRVGGVGVVGALFDLRLGRVIRLNDQQLSAYRVRVDHIGGNQYPLYSVAAIRDVGVFDERLFFGFEELEFGLRLVTAGWNLYCDGEYRLARRAAAQRLGVEQARPSISIQDSSWRAYYSRRNILIILRRHRAWQGFIRVAAASVLKPLVNIPRSPRLAIKAVRVQYRAVWDAVTGRHGKAVEPY